ncbi:NYN domain-containing protein [Blastococcus sp. KM273128]|uniref:NYN domain-containing protein n=1 Tax=Blastococcus sp. KM273128 TaxID=2570314 RepID=UPI001F1DF302|nr:NYN domain-containing protein [Blastococcus sp. KM273128]MCF6744464.1 NYN domain-containing protein [Blastococcus sp. KM273128]
MLELGDGRQRIYRSALYLDFDNLFSGLRQVDPDAATVFANDPGRLVSWLAEGTDEEGDFRRRFLVRDCYLNPQVYAGFRAQFVAAGFRVIDCPSLTQRGKSSADTHIVLDVVDALNHATRYDEFVICSADADFSPLMTKLRRHDRRTLMVAAGPYAAAYEAVCDSTVGPMQLLEAFQAPVPKVAVPERTAPAPDALTDDQLAGAASAIRALVEASPGPVAGATAASAGMRAVPQIAAAGWGQARDGFGGFIRDHLGELEFRRNSSGGWLLDPARHDEVPGDDADSDDVVARVCRVTHAPQLTAEQYAALFEHLAAASRDGLPLNRLGLEVRERATATGEPVSRRAVNFVIQGLVYGGIELRNGTLGPWELAEAWRKNLRNLCDQAGLELSEADDAALDQWVLGALPGGT